MTTKVENLSRDKLIEEIAKLEDQLKFYQTKLRNLVTAYKSLVNEKNALEASFKAVQNVEHSNKEIAIVHSSNNDSPTKTETDKQENKTEIATLMNSLTVLSAEKCRMEASFQADRKALRADKEKNELQIKELEEKFKKVSTESAKEIENLKSKLIISRHDREKEQNEHSVRMRELQRLLSQEREERESIQKTLSDLTPKFEMLMNKEEVERFKESDFSEKFCNLQKKHLCMLEVERRRVIQAESESKEQVAIYERRVASLEMRLTELSHTVANYHRLRQQDQNEITKLKAYIDELGNQAQVYVDTKDDLETLKETNEMELNSYLQSLIEKMSKYKALIINVNRQCEKPVDIDALICDKCKDIDRSIVSLEDYERLSHECEELRDKYLKMSKNNAEVDSYKVKIQVLQDQNSVLNSQLETTILRCEKQIDSYKAQIRSLGVKYEADLHSIENSFKTQIFELEQQLQKQRDRTLALLDEKELEISTLKSSFQLFVPGSKKALEFPSKEKFNKYSAKRSQLSGILEGIETSGTESPHILHYSHELARRDVEITGLRKTYIQLEMDFRSLNKDIIISKQKHLEEISLLKEEIVRLERCKSREGANLEYLKNVIVNYLVSKDVSSKKHMFNAIAAVLKFSDSEITNIKGHL